MASKQKTRTQRTKAAREMLKRYESDADAPCDLGGGFSLVALHAAFDLVKNADHWKDRIDWTGRIALSEVEIVEAAVVFFTGSVAHVTPDGGGRYRVTAAGYWEAVGA